MNKTAVFAFFLMLAFAAQPVYSQSIPLGDLGERTISSIGGFYKEHTGVVAFLPGAGSSSSSRGASTHKILKDGYLYKIQPKGELMFRVNHYTNYDTTTYLGITVFLLYEPGNENYEAIDLSRNPAMWYGDTGRKLLDDVRGPTVSGLPITVYDDAHSQEVLAEADKLLKFTWHAAPEQGKSHSWAYRSRWAEFRPKKINLLRQALHISGPIEIGVKGRMIKFRTRNSLWGGISKGPLDFGFDPNGAIGAYVRIFSPADSKFSREFYLDLRPL